MSAILAAVLTACTPVGSESDQPRFFSNQPQSLYVLIKRDPRLPAEFSTIFKQQTQTRLPKLSLNIDENQINDQNLAKADWMITLQATRILPKNVFAPSTRPTINGLIDCLAGSAVGPGVIMFPCEYSAGYDFIEASIRDIHGKTVKTYSIEQQSDNWFWVLPFSALRDWLTGTNQKRVWLALIDSLYDKMRDDDIFRSVETGDAVRK